MISESQERMVAVVAPERLDDVRAVCARWELPCTVIGEVTDHGELRALFDGEVVGAIPAGLLTDECPRYEVEQTPRADAAGARRPGQRRAEDLGLRAVRPARRLAHGAPARASTRPCCGSTARAASPSRSTARRSASATRSAAGWRAVMEAALNVACAGGEPLALTDCLNFGNPEQPEIGWELAQAIDGIAAGGRRARHPGRLGQRLALQRDRRRADPADAGRRLRRARRRRARGSRRAGGAATASSCCAARAPRSSASSGRTRSRFTLAHDVSDGGVALALREAAAWSRRRADVAVADGPGVRRRASRPATDTARLGRRRRAGQAV